MLKMTPERAYYKAWSSGKRLPELELIIQQDAKWAYIYARNVISGRWPGAEETIQKNAGYAYLYAEEVIKGRWPEAEPFIKQSAQWAYSYAKDVLKGRWLEAEEVIAQSDYKEDYIYRFFSEPVVTKEQYSDFEWERAGAVGCFAPRRLFERKESILDVILSKYFVSNNR